MRGLTQCQHIDIRECNRKKAMYLLCASPRLRQQSPAWVLPQGNSFPEGYLSRFPECPRPILSFHINKPGSGPILLVNYWWNPQWLTAKCTGHFCNECLFLRYMGTTHVQWVLDHELQLFGQICTSQEGTKIDRNAFTLHSAVSQYYSWRCLSGIPSWPREQCVNVIRIRISVINSNNSQGKAKSLDLNSLQIPNQIFSLCSRHLNRVDRLFMSIVPERIGTPVSNELMQRDIVQIVWSQWAGHYWCQCHSSWYISHSSVIKPECTARN